MSTEKLNFSLAIPERLVPGGIVIRTAGTADEPLFCLADVCAVLEIGNPSDVRNRLDDDEIELVNLNTLGQIEGIRGNPNVTFVTEPGLYAVILRSDKPQAKPFRRWVTGEVLPAIRKHGCYPAPEGGVAVPTSDPLDALLLTVQELIRQKKELAAVQARQLAHQEALADVEHLAHAALDYQQGNYGYYAALAFLKIHGVEATIAEASKLGVRASRLCRERVVEIRKTRDPRFGLVNLYPESVLEDAWESIQGLVRGNV